MIKAAIVYSKDRHTVVIEVEAKTVISLLDEFQQIDYESIVNGYKFRSASIIRICEREN